jgi:predicted phosphodiesterase
MERDFPDKKARDWKPQQVDEVLIRARELEDKFEIGQKEATWVPHADYANLPITILLMTDTHYGSTRANTRLMNEHIDLIKDTPNFYLVHNGDHTDNFNANLGRLATGMFEDPIPTQNISRAWAAKLKELDDVGKIGVLGFGNHNDFGEGAGQDWYETFLGEFKCPIFTSGGLLHILVGGQHYELGMTHEYWGTSKLNPTNANKRFLDFEYPESDITFLGHTHQSEGLQFEKGGVKRIGVIGGTYKDDDEYARKNGIGGRSGSPGWAITLWPDQKQMQLWRDIKIAQDFTLDRIFREESK